MHWRLNSEEIAEQCGLTELIVMTLMDSIFEKTGKVGVCNRLEVILFVRDAVSEELRRRRA
jgi:hypothetical protein